MSIKKGEFQKSLDRLQTLVKGTQLYHTDSDSNPKSWTGGTQEDLDEHKDGIDDNGTDYNGVRKSLAEKVRKSLALTPAEVAIAEGKDPRQHIAGKVSKGQKLTAAEDWAIKAGYAGMAKAGEGSSDAPEPGEQDSNSKTVETHAANDDEVEGDAKKSFGSKVGNSLELQKGIEASPFLYELTKAIGEALNGSETRISKSVTSAVGHLASRLEAVEKSLANTNAAQGTFNKSLAEAVVGIGEVVGGSVEMQAQALSQPVGGPKSHMRAPTGNSGNVNILAKSFDGPGGLDMNINKSQLADAMAEMVSKSLLAPLDVIKFESTGEMVPSVRQKVSQYLTTSKN
jgi:hypothetical protein